MTQSCDFSNGVELHFLTTDVRLRPYEVDVRHSRARYTFARVKISRDAASLLLDRHDDQGIDREAVHLKIGGVVQSRYLFEKEQIRTEQNTEQAWIELADPIHELSHYTVTAIYEKTNPFEVIRELYDHIDPNNGVIEGIQVVDDGLEELITESYQSQLTRDGRLNQGTAREYWSGSDSDGWARRIHEGGENFIAGIWAWSRDKNPIRSSLETDGGFVFDDITVLRALEMVNAEFGTTSWVREDGVLWFGLPEFLTGTIHSIYGDPSVDRYVMKEYNVTRGATEISSVRAHGSPFGYLPEVGTAANLVPWAEAKVPGVDGEELLIEEPRKLRSLESLEEYVLNVLVYKFAEYENGNIVFNGLASDADAELARMQIGDWVTVAPEIEKHCATNVDGGLFVINEIQHRINTRVGWQTTVTVGGLPIDVETTSWFYDRQSDTYYDDLDEVGE